LYDCEIRISEEHAVRGRKPKPTALHILHGTFNRTCHGNRIDAPQNFGHRVGPDRAAQLSAACALSPEEQAERQKEIAERMRRIKG
jgi:hypothetical protein